MPTNTSIQSAEVSAATIEELNRTAVAVRRWILQMTHQAGSGHPTSALSAVELMVDLFFGGFFRFDTKQPEHLANDRLIFSKGHASPLFYSLWAAAGAVAEDDLMSYRSYGSRLEGHPTSRFRYTEAATGSLGQGLSVGVGMALAAERLDDFPYRTFVLLGDSEMAEGSQWEAMELAAYYRLRSLIGILDVNRLGQRGETMYGHDLSVYQRRIEAFGWRTLVVDDGHSHEQIISAYTRALEPDDRPTMLIAKTLKGKGVSFLEDQPGWHGKALDDQKTIDALSQLQTDHPRPKLKLSPPPKAEQQQGQALYRLGSDSLNYSQGEKVATRTAYGHAVSRIAKHYPQVVALDGEVSNSTRADKFGEEHPDRFLEMFIAEQNMVGAATGLALRGKIPFVSTFAAFLTRSFDQIRMIPYSRANVKLVGSHCGVSIGQDGPSQMGLEDIAMFRTLPESVVLYPCDAVSTERAVEVMADHEGLCYLRTTRGQTTVIYDDHEQFPIGGCKLLRSSEQDQLAIIAAGITLHAALDAYDLLQQVGISARIIDMYSIKPLDRTTICDAAEQTGLVLTVEDHFPEGGIGEAVAAALSNMPTPVHIQAVRHRPVSGSPERLLEEHGLSARAITETVEGLLLRQKGLKH